MTELFVHLKYGFQKKGVGHSLQSGTLSISLPTITSPPRMHEILKLIEDFIELCDVYMCIHTF